MKLNMGNELIWVDGNLVERDALRIAEAINAYDENLRLICLDPRRADGISDAPFIVIAKYRDRDEWYPVFRAWQLDDNILVRLQASDMQRTDVLANVMSSEENWRKMNQARYQQERDLMQEQTLAVISSNKIKYTMRDEKTGDYITFYDDKPAVRGEPGGTKYFT